MGQQLGAASARLLDEGTVTSLSMVARLNSNLTSRCAAQYKPSMVQNDGTKPVSPGCCAADTSALS